MPMVFGSTLTFHLADFRLFYIQALLRCYVYGFVLLG